MAIGIKNNKSEQLNARNIPLLTLIVFLNNRVSVICYIPVSADWNLLTAIGGRRFYQNSGDILTSGDVLTDISVELATIGKCICGNANTIDTELFSDEYSAVNMVFLRNDDW